jgi:large subunit ribosomal protein L25
MSETMSLSVEIRTSLGSRHSEQLRCQGKVPAIVYGHKQEPVSVAMDRHDFTEALHHGHRIFDVDLGGNKETVLVKDLQYDYLGKTIIHADMMRVNLREMVRVTVPVVHKGTAQGTHEGGMIDEVLDHIEIECRVMDIPEQIAVSVRHLGVGDAVHAKEVQLPTDAGLLTDPEAILFICHLPAKAAAEEEEVAEGEGEEAAGPEVITERKAEEESAE